MNNTVFAENLKKFRVAKNMTQEQVADALCINSQTVSRWECETTLPDVMTLPELANLYGVTVDDFYRKRSIAYDNYAQRLTAVYEKTRDPEDFIRCRVEYQKLIKSDEMTTADKWHYAVIHDFMLRYCQKNALEWYDKAISDGPEMDTHAYIRARSMRNAMMFGLGKGDEVIQEQTEKCRCCPDNAQEWLFLIEAYFWAENYEEAYRIFKEAQRRFPDNWRIYIYGGDVYEALKNYEEAFRCWDKAGELGTEFYEEYYSKASCYDEIGEYEKAYVLYMELADQLRMDNYDVEAEMAENEAKEIKLKMK